VKGRIWVAFSGGLDSRVCLDWILSQNLNAEIRAIHINHNLSPNAKDWVQFCEKCCADLNIPLEVFSVHINARSEEGIEAEARRLRYDIFAQSLQPGDILVLGHHADDQAETVLLQLLRGAGPRGLSGMAERSPFASGEIWRPFLHKSRAELEEYAKAHQLDWIEDESNLQQKYARNYVRHTLMPLIKARWPEAARTLQRSAHWCQEAENLLQAEALRKLEKSEGFPQTLSLAILRQEDPRWQRLLFRQWLTVLNVSMPSQKKCDTILSTFLTARPDAQPYEHWGKWHLHRYRDQLYCLTDEQLQNQILEFTLDHLENLPKSGRTLKKRFQEAGIPPWLREDYKKKWSKS
jgi:tRNA(Ile)-lysidine synthase